MTEAERNRLSQVDPSLAREHLRSPLGVATVKRYIVECAQVQAGDEALILYERQGLNASHDLVEIMAELLREMDVKVVCMQVDTLFPRREGVLPQSFYHQERERFPKTVFSAIRAADE